MSLGPTGAPGYFQYFIHNILPGRIREETTVYLDDIVVYTEKAADHNCQDVPTLST